VVINWGESDQLTIVRWTAASLDPEQMPFDFI
jgi:hypothetical protein